MRRCCFLSMDDMTGYVSDDELAIEPLRELGWQVSTVSWRDKDTDWNEFEAVVLRTTWDYQDSPGEFIDVLKKIDASSARLENPLSIVEWNLDKRYLRDLQRHGIRIVPTIWGETEPTNKLFIEWQATLDTSELILKPTVSATAQDTFRLTEFLPEIVPVFSGRPYMVQPFVPEIVDEGEYSLFFFNGAYSHTILKAPKRGDFRVQEEHGGIITGVSPMPDLLDAAFSITSLIDPVPLYSRIDLVRHKGEWLLMELELIEPALYFRMDADSPRFFAREFDRRMNEL